MYQLLFRLVFSRMQPETAHRLAFDLIRFTHQIGLGKLYARWFAPHPDLRVRAFGVVFPSPFGLAAGFDKNGVGIDALADIGFGHVEIGTITGVAQPGNPRPRLFRLIPDRALINRMGFNNSGAERVAATLRTRRAHDGVVLGINIGKSRVCPVDEALSDYLKSAKLLAPLADYLVVNVSSPNTPGLRSLQAVEHLRPLLSGIQSASGETPVLVKIAPDMIDEEILAVADLAVELGLAGMVATNTTIGRDGLASSPELIAAAGDGGLSGAPLAARSLAVLRLLARHTEGNLVLVSVGGVATAEDVWQRLQAGATLVQGYSEFVYSGPMWARKVNRGLHTLMQHDSAGDASPTNS